MNKPRLIDSNKLLEVFEQYLNETASSGESISKSARLSLIKWVIGKVNEQPTAYDVEGVVERLEAELYKELEPIKTAFNFGINKAIEIVKGGAVDD